MDVLSVIHTINTFFTVPSTILFLCVAILLTIKHRFMQIRALPYFFKLIRQGCSTSSAKKHDQSTIGAFQALFTAMGSTIGMGNVVGPSLAIYSGGPGALFWLVLYIFFASSTKLTEVVLALYSRKRMPDGYIIGGPMQYLALIHPLLATWYMSIMIFLFMGWSGLQSNTLAQIFEKLEVPRLATGLSLAVITYFVIKGGIQRIGAISSKLVPLMFVMYVGFSLFILFKDMSALEEAFGLIFSNILTPAAPVGGFLGASIMTAMQHGIYRSIFITEAGLGVSSIAHSMSDTKRPLDQGILAMYSMAADAMLCTISGLLVLVTGVWMVGDFRSTLVYEVFSLNAPGIGQTILVVSITLFVLTTVIGNSFNGIQAFSSLTNHRYVNWYIMLALIIITCGSIAHTQLAWDFMDLLLTFVALPNIIGVTILAFKKSDLFDLKQS